MWPVATRCSRAGSVSSRIHMSDSVRMCVLCALLVLLMIHECWLLLQTRGKFSNRSSIYLAFVRRYKGGQPQEHADSPVPAKQKKSILTCQIWKSCCWEPRLRLVGCRGVSLVWIQKTSSLAGPHLSQPPALICNPSIPTVVLKDPTKFSRGAFQTLMASCWRQREPEPEFEKIS